MGFYEEHQKYLKNTDTFRKYGGVPDSQGRVYDLKGKGKEHERQINAPTAKFKRSLRNDQYQDNLSKWGERELARANHKTKALNKRK
jgi:hypothetical protein